MHWIKFVIKNLDKGHGPTATWVRNWYEVCSDQKINITRESIKFCNFQQNVCFFIIVWYSKVVLMISSALHPLLKNLKCLIRFQKKKFCFSEFLRMSPALNFSFNSVYVMLKLGFICIHVFISGKKSKYETKTIIKPKNIPRQAM